MTEPILEGWTIFDHPPDYPADYVARRWIATTGSIMTQTNVILRHPDLDILRGMLALVAPDVLRLPRCPADQSIIIEIWISCLVCASATVA